MAGHSQFSNIMHRKGAQDKKRAKIFNKLAREIMVAAKSGQPDPDTNARLRNAIVAARQSNMPNDRIKRAIEQGSPNSADAANYEEIRYEGYGPGGTAVIVEALTDNRNRTAGDVRVSFSKKGGSMGESNSVAFMFTRLGSIIFPVDVIGADKMFELAVEAGAENVETLDDLYEITTDPSDFTAVKEAIEEKLGDCQKSELIWKPNNTVSLDEDQARKMFDMIELLEDLDDVQKVFSNFDVSEEILAQLTA